MAFLRSLAHHRVLYRIGAGCHLQSIFVSYSLSGKKKLRVTANDADDTLGFAGKPVHPMPFRLVRNRR
jgi:hypothetical protein